MSNSQTIKSIIANVVVTNLLSGFSSSSGFFNSISHMLLNFGVSFGIESVANLADSGLDYLMDQMLDEETKDSFVVEGLCQIFSGYLRINIADIVDYSSLLNGSHNVIDAYFQTQTGGLYLDGNSFLHNHNNSWGQSILSSGGSFLKMLGLESNNMIAVLESKINGLKLIANGAWTLLKGTYNYFTADGLTAQDIKFLIKAGDQKAIECMSFQFDKEENLTKDQMIEKATKQTMKKFEIIKNLQNSSYYIPLNKLVPIFLDSKPCQALKSLYSDLFKHDVVKYEKAMQLVDLEAKFLTFTHLIGYAKADMEFTTIFQNATPDIQKKLYDSLQAAEKLALRNKIMNKIIKEDEAKLGIKIPYSIEGDKYAEVIKDEFSHIEAIHLFADYFISA